MIDRWVKAFGGKRFSDLCRKDLERLGLSKEWSDRIEAVCVVAQIDDKGWHEELNREVVAQVMGAPRGKRAKPQLRALVDEVAPLLLAAGICFSSAERSKMVSALRRVADELQIDGEPRDLVRGAQKREERLRKLLAEELSFAVRRALQPLRDSQAPAEAPNKSPPPLE